MNYITGGDRECIYLCPSIIRKRRRRVITNTDFEIIDDYIHDINQTSIEINALNYIEKNAPQIVKNFFPRLLGTPLTILKVPTYSDTKLYELSFIPRINVVSKDLDGYSQARVYYETVIDMEAITPFEKLGIEYQKTFLTKDSTFFNFALSHGATKKELNVLDTWLHEHINPLFLKKIDYLYTYSNWGVNRHSGYPQILDLGYFVFKE